MLTLETMYVFAQVLPQLYGVRSDIAPLLSVRDPAPRFIEQSQRRNPQRGVRWFTSAQPYVADEQKVTASLPLITIITGMAYC